jgi:hypothetical protein
MFLWGAMSIRAFMTFQEPESTVAAHVEQESNEAHTP